MEPIVLQEIVIVLAASVLIIYLSHKLKLPSVVGFLLTGVFIGPGGLHLVKNTETVGILAEIGVVMLLFTIGLEFEPARLKRIQRDFWAVDKIGPFGTGTKKVAVIIGVHPQEGITHVGMMNALKTLASQLKNVQIWVFKVYVNEKNSYEKSRMDGQLLAQKYVVPNIDKTYKLAVDIHGNRGLYASNDFVFAPSKRPLSVSYANKIISKTTYLKYYAVADGSSPAYVTIPIANKGIPAVIFELYLNVNNYNTVMYNKCLQLVKALNTLTYV